MKYQGHKNNHFHGKSWIVDFLHLVLLMFFLGAVTHKLMKQWPYVMYLIFGLSIYIISITAPVSQVSEDYIRECFHLSEIFRKMFSINLFGIPPKFLVLLNVFSSDFFLSGVLKTAFKGTVYAQDYWYKNFTFYKTRYTCLILWCDSVFGEPLLSLYIYTTVEL